ncbi:MAG: hypothetical protein MI924_39370 [Chloroflexales bacterium]|nr:hypothetical protein [Chloroflexales bacterium]
MAGLIKIGDMVINLNLMTQAFFKPGSVRLYFAVATGKASDMHLDMVDVFGRDAAALRAYLEAHSEDLLAFYPPAE